ncbi:DMT family transporter [Novosphingobium olei]|nr:DMT family transporter [Novosphingobium olei]
MRKGAGLVKRPSNSGGKVPNVLMRLRDFFLLVLVCVIWALSNVVSRIVVGQWMVPPLFFAAVRFAVVMLATLPWLLPMPRPAWRMIVVGMLMGGGNFAVLFLGLRTVTPSMAAIVVQSSVPITTLLSVVLLGERIHWRRGLGIALALAGVLIVVWQPGLQLSAGVLYILGAAFAGSLGAVLMKQMEEVPAIRLQAWVGLTSLLPLALFSWGFEHHQIDLALRHGWHFGVAIAFSALVVSVGAHTVYYSLIKRYEANLIAPLTLLTPLFTIALGYFITHDRLDARMLLGAAIALIGVLIVALRRSKAPVAEAAEHG